VAVGKKKTKVAPKKATAAPPKVTVELRIALSLASAPGVVRWVEGNPVKSATVAVQGTTISGTTDAKGRARLAIMAPVTGRVITVDAATAEVSSGPAGPGHGAGGASAPRFQFRPFKVTVDTDANGFVPGTATISLAAIAGSPPHALLLSLTKDKLTIDWKPDFIKSGNAKKVASKTNDFLVLHRTGGNDIRNSINTFFNPSSKVCIHYLVDVDGHVVKLVHEDDAVNHTGPAFWQGRTDINGSSVGIEHVNGGSNPFTAEQNTSSLRLVREIRAAHASIGRQQVMGHMDIACNSATNRSLSSRRIDDPGVLFQWDQFENANLVRRRAVGVPTALVFGIGPGQSVTFPGATRNRSPTTLVPDFSGIQTALSAIGYSIAPDGVTVSGAFDQSLASAINAFQRRYFSGGNQAQAGVGFKLGRIDFETAVAIQAVQQDTGP
jgi:N-acetyl-anhydromuramyl-L-alanine amidase AmpD